jgi:hypothetical protein
METADWEIPVYSARSLVVTLFLLPIFFLLSGLPVPLSADVCRGFQPFFGTLSGTLSGMFCRSFSPFDRFDLF